MKLRLPKKILTLPTDKRAAVAENLVKALGFRATLTKQQCEQHVWKDDPNPSIADLENFYYESLAVPLWNSMLDLYNVLGLEFPDIEELTTLETPIKKSFTDELKKSTNKDKPRRPKKVRFRYRPDGKPFTSKQMQEMENILKRYHVKPKQFAEELAVRSTVIGRFINESEDLDRGTIHLLAQSLPVNLEQAKKPFTLTGRDTETKYPQLPLQPQEVQAVEWATQFGGEHIQTEQQKIISGVKNLVAQARRERWEPRDLERKLFEKFGEYNRDWRRIALTELAEATNNGYLSGLEDGQAVIGQSAVDQCDACLKLVNNKVYTFRNQPGDPNRELWVGKSNVGRKKRDWTAAVIMHPHCRCRWQRFNTRFFKVNEDGQVVRRTIEEIRGDAP